MNLAEAFKDLQSAVNADPKIVDEARRQRNAFRKAFDGEGDVERTFAAGSFARGSQIEPIKDVDLLVLYKEEDHPDWNRAGDSAEAALEHTRTRIKDLLGDPDLDQEVDAVRHTVVRDHAVTCWLDDPDDEDAFTVDVVPALNRAEGGFWIPEKSSRMWIPTDPLYLVYRVLDAHERSNRRFVPLLRDLKRWTLDHGKILKGLAMEVLALEHLSLDEPPHVALERFFVAAAEAVFQPIEDPAGLCGEIQNDLDRSGASKALREAGDLAWRANRAADRDDHKNAICLWRKIFGPVFPEPPGGCGDGRPGVVPPAVVPVPQRPVQDLQQG
jgi:predicted nucleotidyltransferase